MKSKKCPILKDMVRVAAANRLESNDFLKDDTGKTIPYIQEQFTKFSFLKEDSVKNVVFGYLNKIDRGI